MTVHGICDICNGPTYNYYCDRCYTEKIYRNLYDMRVVEKWKASNKKYTDKIYRKLCDILGQMEKEDEWGEEEQEEEQKKK